MDYNFTDISTDDDSLLLRESESINPCLLKNSKNDLIKALNFLKSEDKFLYIHGFLGTGKRQFIKYLCEYLSDDVVTLEYYCKESTVCDDILLTFTDCLDSFNQTHTLNVNAKITTLAVKFQNLVSSIKKPVLIILQSLDNIDDSALEYITETFSKALKEPNVKIIITTCALKTGLMGDIEESKTIFLKAFTKDIFKEFIHSNNIEASDKQIEDLYSLTRGYYLYSALSVKIIQSTKMSAVEFLQKMKNASSNFDSYLGEYYLSLIPVEIRNLFWVLRAVRHGLSQKALTVLEVYDEFSIEYLKSNLLIFQDNNIIYMHDYFAQRVPIMLPENTEIRLHKFIINVYEQQLKEPLISRSIFISRQSLRAEIDYHSKTIEDIENGNTTKTTILETSVPKEIKESNKTDSATSVNTSINELINEAKKLANENQITKAIEKYKEIADSSQIDSATLVDVRLKIAKLYNAAGDDNSAMHYYELVEAYYKYNKEYINLNYLYFEMTNLYYKLYKHSRAIETIKKVIYSVDTPQSLMVSACTLLGNIYSDINNPEEAFSYYQKALDSLDENVEDSILAELYFKFALANDDKGDYSLAFEYYNRCISITKDNKYLALAYSNLASCYYENQNIDDALNCFKKAYIIEKDSNNYDGIYYTSSHIAELLSNLGSKDAINYLKEAKQSAEFLDEAFYIVEASIALGDYYYNIPDKSKEALTEYCKARRTALNSHEEIDMKNIEKRIEDMKLRMPEQTFTEILTKYGK